MSDRKKTVISQPHPAARKYLELPFFCQFVSYGNNVLASASEEFASFAEKYTKKYGSVYIFETPAVLELDCELQKYGHRVCFMAQYYLPVPEIIVPTECGFELRVMHKPDFEEYYIPQFGNAICAEHSERCAGSRGVQRRSARRSCRSIRRLRNHVADRRGRSSGIPQAGHCLGNYVKACP